MYKKIIGILVMMLLFVTASSVTGNIDIEKGNKAIPLTVNAVVWSDNFDSYAVGSPIDGQGGWDTWDLTHELTAYVSNNHSHSVSNSMELKYAEGFWDDMIHLFYGINSGIWNLTVWQYIPSDMIGHSCLHLFGEYKHGAQHDQSHLGMALQSKADTGKISDWRNGNSLPLIMDEWVKINIEIDFDQDIVTVYYDDTFLESISWSGGIRPLNLAAINPCNEGYISSESYFDDFSLVGDISENSDLYCEGELNWFGNKPGHTVTGSFILQNNGPIDSYLNWEIESKPDWGEWSIDPNGGTDLAGWNPITVNVEIVTPEDKDTEFTGELKIVNSDNPDDYEIIDIYLENPRSRTGPNMLFFQLFERFPNTFPILRQIFGL